MAEAEEVSIYAEIGDGLMNLLSAESKIVIANILEYPLEDPDLRIVSMFSSADTKDGFVPLSENLALFSYAIDYAVSAGLFESGVLDEPKAMKLAIVCSECRYANCLRHTASKAVHRAALLIHVATKHSDEYLRSEMSGLNINIEFLS